MEKKVLKLLEAIDEIVSDSSMPYREKLALILDTCTEDDQTNLEEFISWFPEGQAPTEESK